MEKFDRTIQRFDEINAEDPNKEIVAGELIPKELLYSQRMSAMLFEFSSQASETLRLAARCQHIRRWSIPREHFPMDRQGYLMWRSQLKNYHADLAGSIMDEQGYSHEAITKVQDLLKKRRLKTDEETQALEDVVCLVFLNYYFDEFLSKHEETKLHDIVRKTWSKMSEKGHQAAESLNLSAEASEVLQKALFR